MTTSIVYLIPAFLDEEVTEVIPAYVLEAVRSCQVFFTENERSARRYLKSLWKEMPINEFQWYTIHKAEEEIQQEFLQALRANKNIGIISEAGCPGVADPGQILVSRAQQEGARVKPLVGPSSILLALMASGMNGQQFQFSGYLPIDQAERMKAIRELEKESERKNLTQIFIETPYRNNQLLEILLKVCKPSTRLCIAANLTSKNESVITRSIEAWKKAPPELHRQPAIFCLHAG
jgi:16S rRNA (cytidine1402-2'-O)-methyltransferase